MMTRKHFEVAAIIAKHDCTAKARRKLAVETAELIAKTNPNFDRGRFLRACGVTEEASA